MPEDHDSAPKGPVGGAHGNREGGATDRVPNEAQLGGTGPGSLGNLARKSDQFTPETGQSGPGEGEGRGPMSDRATENE